MSKLMKGMSAVVIALALVFGIVSCGGGGSPTAAAKGFIAAVEKGDAKAIEKYSTKETAALMTMFGDKAKTSMAEIGKVNVTSEKIDGDNATVTLTFADGSSEDLSLVKDGGQWKVNVDK